MFHKKQIFKLNILRQLATDEKSCVSLVSSTRLLALPPFFLNDMKAGILYMLNAMLKKYDRSLGGIVIGYQNIKILMDENTGIIPIGTFETEVNISVEFYIFQPKIGNYLEGVVNKKSNNHIGCLVHRYFNATILKPDDIDYDDWICRDFSVDDKINFKVKDLDFTTSLPYIEGVVEHKEENIKGNMNHNIDKIFTDHMTESSEIEFLFSKKLSSKKKNFKNEFLDNKKEKNRNEAEIRALEDSISTSSAEFISCTSPRKKEKKKEKINLEFDSHNKTEEAKNRNEEEVCVFEDSVSTSSTELISCTSPKKKEKEKEKINLEFDGHNESEEAKNRNEEEVCVFEDSISTSSTELISCTSPRKKEKKKEKINLEFDSHNKTEEERSSKDKELIPGSFNNEDKKAEENYFKEEKEKEKNKHDNDDQSLSAVKNSKKEEDPTPNFLEKCVQLENEYSDEFVKEEKSKKVKKKKKKEKNSLDSNKTSMCLPVEETEDMFCSTQLGPVSERKKLTMPYFSPILPFDKKRDNEMTSRTLDFSAHLNSVKELQGKEKKKKNKKHKAEEKDESVGEPAPKKMKTSDTPKKKAKQVQVNGTDVKSGTQSLMEEMYKKLLNQAKEQLNLSDKESSKAKKKKKSKSREKKATTQSELSKNSTTQVNGTEENSEVQSILDKLLEDEIKRVRENSIASDREKSKTHGKNKTDKQEKKASKERSKSSPSKVKKRSKTKTSLSDVNGKYKKFDVHHGS